MTDDTYTTDMQELISALKAGHVFLYCDDPAETDERWTVGNPREPGMFTVPGRTYRTAPASELDALLVSGEMRHINKRIQ